MTAPRQILAGTTYLVTRRCVFRMFFLVPSKACDAIFLYVLAVAAKRYGIQLHAYCVMSNHYHLVLTDPLAQLPVFEQFLNGTVTRALNVLYRKKDAIWNSGTYSAVALISPEDVVDKAAYTLANPVAAGLVRSARQWPGLWSGPEAVGAGERVVKRPPHYFDEDGTMPEEASLQLTAPPGFASAAEFRKQLAAALAVKEAEAVKRVGTFLGAARVKAQKVTDSPSSEERPGGLNPRVAAKNTPLRVEALKKLMAFIDAYRAALEAWREGRKKTVFPAGTYRMRVFFGVACASAG